MTELQMANAKYELARSFVARLLKSCQKKNNYCDHPLRDCSGCNIYEMAKGNEGRIEEWILDQYKRGNLVD